MLWYNIYHETFVYIRNMNKNELYNIMKDDNDNHYYIYYKKKLQKILCKLYSGVKRFFFKYGKNVRKIKISHDFYV